MNTEHDIIQVAEFSPSIKSYMFVLILFILAISCIGIPLMLIWMLGVGNYYAKKYYENLKCRLTSRNLEFSHGAFFKVEKTIPLENIQDLTFIDNPILKYFDLRILKIETAGNSAAKGSDMKLVGIIDAYEFKRKVLEQREVLMTSDHSVNAPGNLGNDSVMQVLTDIKNLLTDIKNK